MKVSEAKTKVCPFIQDAIFTSPEGTMGTFNVPQNITCICGDCMAWVYTKTKSDYPNKNIVVYNVEAKRNQAEMVCGELDDNEKEGYCQRLQS